MFLRMYVISPHAIITHHYNYTTHESVFIFSLHTLLILLIVQLLLKDLTKHKHTLVLWQKHTAGKQDKNVKAFTDASRYVI